jgi:hypothetical protein
MSGGIILPEPSVVALITSGGTIEGPGGLSGIFNGAITMSVASTWYQLSSASLTPGTYLVLFSGVVSPNYLLSMTLSLTSAASSSSWSVTSIGYANVAIVKVVTTTTIYMNGSISSIASGAGAGYGTIIATCIL